MTSVSGQAAVYLLRITSTRRGSLSAAETTSLVCPGDPLAYLPVGPPPDRAGGRHRRVRLATIPAG
jgi:hypothetical protein